MDAQMISLLNLYFVLESDLVFEKYIFVWTIVLVLRLQRVFPWTWCLSKAKRKCYWKCIISVLWIVTNLVWSVSSLLSHLGFCLESVASIRVTQHFVKLARSLEVIHFPNFSSSSNPNSQLTLSSWRQKTWLNLSIFGIHTQKWFLVFLKCFGCHLLV